MQEIAIFLSSVAGACTAAAIKKFPKGRHTISTLGVNSHIRDQINSLKLEKEILTKTISRLYQYESEFSKIQRDKLLLRYQQQLGVVLAKIEKLEDASKHPDLGPLGEGLVTLMDQKLSSLDKRLYEISAKINLVNTQIPTRKQEEQLSVKKIKDETKIEKSQVQDVIETSHSQINNLVIPKPYRPVEITTLTELPDRIPESFFKTELVPQIKEELVRPQQEQSPPAPITKKPTQKVTLPEEDKEDDDDDDLDKIKGEIMKTLSKLEQAEVE